MNGDSKPDLVVANTGSDTVGILLGNSDGTFQTAATYDVGGQTPVSVAVGNLLLRFGEPQVVVANACADKSSCSGSRESGVGVLFGDFYPPPATYRSGGSEATSVKIADVNNDGIPDLLVGHACASTNAAKCTANAPGSVGVLLGHDDIFTLVKTYNSGGFQTYSLAVADVNGDGQPDVLVANFCASSSHCIDGSVGVLLGNGDGTLRAPLIYSTGGNIPISVAIADVNGDGKPDLVVTNADSSNIGVLLNNTGIHNPTSTSLTSSLNPSSYGQKVTWTVTVTSSGSVMLTGTVKFTWSGHTIGSAILNSSGVATFSRSNLNADSYPLTAVYGGDSSNLGSISVVLNQVVLQATTSATLTSSPNPSPPGQAVTFTATISSPTVIPTGPVTFTSGKTVLGTAQLTDGKAKFTISTLAVGSTRVTATYYGNSNIAKSSASVTQTVQ
jgi:Bacterial Ig-like domain (group 3)/FG-GAP-like repeat/FG-GAP repeat